MLFSDECQFTLSRNDGCQRCWSCQGIRHGCHQTDNAWRPLEVVVLQSAGVPCQYRTALHLVNGTVTSQYYLDNIINPVFVPLHEQHRPDFIFMDYNAPAHRGRIIREQLLEAGVPQMQWPALSLDLNPIENLWDQLSRCVEGHKLCSPEPQWHYTKEEWNAMPQQSISRLVNSTRRHCQAVIDAQGRMTSYWDQRAFV